jgi:hypothetical protein
VGTAVYYQFEDGWYQGQITGYDSDAGAYETSWSDGDVEIFTDLDAVDQMVAAATNLADEFYAPWAAGTAVYNEFEDGWYQGEITGYDSDAGAYETSWSDGDVEIFTDLDAVDQMVAAAANLPADSYDPWPSGTVVYNEFEDGWYQGQITYYQDGVYTTTWTDGDIEYYDDKDLVDQMVAQAGMIPDSKPNVPQDPAKDTTTTSYEPWALGTAVKYRWESVLYEGEIVSYLDGTYTIAWSDKEVETYDDLDLVDQMVEDAYEAITSSANANTKKKSMSGGGKFFLVVAVFAAVGAAAFFLQRHKRQKRGQELEEAVEVIAARLEADLPRVI